MLTPTLSLTLLISVIIHSNLQHEQVHAVSLLLEPLSYNLWPSLSCELFDDSGEGANLPAAAHIP